MGRKISKRTFLKDAGLTVAGFTACNPFSAPGNKRIPPIGDEGLWKWSKECTFSEITPRGIKCRICPNECILKPGDTSFCRNRVNHRGKLYSIAYGNPCAMNIDPIEKKPFFHFLPGTRAFSIATAGCNFSCHNCQNWSISQTSPKKTRNADLMPPAVVEQSSMKGCRSVAYTYSEPVTFYEYAYDTAVLARKKGIKNVIVSNGYINEKPLRQLCKVLDGATIDLKSFDDNTYIRLNAGGLQPVLHALKIYKDEGVWLEISNLVIPGWSDDMDMIRKMCDWLFQNGFDDTPLHFLRFQPMYKLSHLSPTPVQVLQQASEIATEAGLKFVYTGNVPGSENISTRCPGCGKIVVERKGLSVLRNEISNSSCNFCGEKISGRWN